jgi:hypothetical protein
MFNNNINYNHREDKFHLKPYLFTIFCLRSSDLPNQKFYYGFINISSG